MYAMPQNSFHILAVRACCSIFDGHMAAVRDRPDLRRGRATLLSSPRQIKQMMLGHFHGGPVDQRPRSLGVAAGCAPPKRCALSVACSDRFQHHVEGRARHLGNP